MSSSLTPHSSYSPGQYLPPALQPGFAPGQMPGGSDESPPLPWRRYVAALLRFKWLVLAIALLGTALGVAATRYINPEYVASATVWISDSRAGSRNPSPELLSDESWPELIRSFAVLDRVVRKERLYLWPTDTPSRGPLADFRMSEDRQLAPGMYVMTVSKQGDRWSLARNDSTIESGRLGDSVGTRLGFAWAPAPGQLKPAQQVRFWLNNPRDAAASLRGQLQTARPEGSNLMRVVLNGTDPQRTAATVNAVVNEFVVIATDLKKRSLTESARTLELQIGLAERELKAAETTLESFRVNTITLPSEGSPISAGVEQTRDPVFQHYFDQQLQYESIRNDRLVVERALAEVERGASDVVSLLGLPMVQNDAPELRNALTIYAGREEALRAARVTYRDEHPQVRELSAQLARAREEIPRLGAALVRRMLLREQDLQSRIAGAGRVLRDIPTRTIEEMRLSRNVDVRAALYRTLRTRYEEARIAEASSVPDVSVIDMAAAPTFPTQNTAPRILLMAILASIGAGVALALLLDKLDRRFRYPEQASQDLGLSLLGVVPQIPRFRKGRTDELLLGQIVESFRSLRLSLRHASPGAGPLLLTVTSPGAGDGKSLISANLAISFAESGMRTLLIDGDIRRGIQHETFGLAQSPGLVDALAGEAAVAETVHATSHQNLSVMTNGQPRRRGVELLASDALRRLLGDCAARFDVIIVDSAPMGAGIDAFVVGSVTRNVAVVMRTGRTDRKLAETKLRLAGQLPITILGAILNEVPLKGIYEYYSYLPGYATVDADGESAVGLLR